MAIILNPRLVSRAGAPRTLRRGRPPYDHNIIGEGETEGRVQTAAQAQAQARNSSPVTRPNTAWKKRWPGRTQPR